MNFDSSDLRSSSSHILISSEYEKHIEELKQRLHPHRVVEFLRDEFKIEDAKSVIKEAYVSENDFKYIIIAAQNINIISQNSLLKIFEEPPRNIVFILIVPSKSILLPTIRSRMPLFNVDKKLYADELELSLSSLGLSELFDFVKSHERVDRRAASNTLQALLHRAVFIDKLSLSLKQSEAFELGFKLLELHARPSSVFTMVLMTFLQGSSK